MKRTTFFVFGMLLLLPFVAGAWDTRILSMGSPSLSESMGLPAAYASAAFPAFPTDEFSLGLSSVADALDIWKLPEQLANPILFPTSAVILDWTGSAPLGGNHGLVVPFKRLPLAVGVFVMRPNLNGWVIGTPRSRFGLGATFATNAANQVQAGGSPPAAPTNLADLFIAARLGPVMIGASGGIAYNEAINLSSSIGGTATSDTTYASSSSVITLRLGAGMPFRLFIPFSVDLGGLVLIGNASGSYVSGAAATPASVNDTLTAANLSFSASARVTASIVPTLDVLLLADYASLPQNYAATLAGVAETATTNRIDPASYSSFGVGSGINWRPADTTLVNALLSAYFGSGAWTQEAPSAATRPADSIGWTSLRAVVDGEFIIAGPLVFRGGLSGTVRWVTNALNADSGLLSSRTSTSEFGAGASAGLALKIGDSSILDLALNLSDFVQPSGILQNLTLQASYRADLK